jgi:hypothetical protein
MEKVNVTVNYCDIEFEVRGYYIKGDTYDNTGSTIEDEEILIQGIDVYEILSQRQINDIFDLAIEQIED